MSAEIPEQLKTDIPQTTWGKILSVTPVVMTVVATLLAGLASSEMTTAQYDRSLGAQLQAKAGDQWSYFQAKKLRGALQRNSLELLQATSEVRPFEQAGVPGLPPVATLNLEPSLQLALEAVEKQSPENDIAKLLKPVSEKALATALQAAKDNALAFDAAVARVTQSVEELEKSLPRADHAAARDFIAAKMGHSAARYEAEARLNQTIATLYELQVRKANISADRHHERSGKFFFGMLAAQAAVVISTFAIAARKRNFLWSVAAIAGLAAIIFAIYVYLRV
jgi:hypothetical protein